MKPLNCAATRRRLQAFHDRELAVADQIAVSAHLEWCDQCAAALADLRAIGSALQAFARGRVAVSIDESGSFQRAVLNRVKAEREASFIVRVRAMFDDMHLVYAGLGATVATLVCVVIMLSMMRFASTERPDSLAAIVSVLSMPVECESGNDFIDDFGCRARFTGRFQRAHDAAEQDVVFALEALVASNGRLPNVDVMRARVRRHAAANEVEVIDRLLDSVWSSRVDAGNTWAPQSGNMLRLIETATVRASKPVDLQLPPGKKRAQADSAAIVLALRF
jgi:putative zinc finger protein